MLLVDFLDPVIALVAEGGLSPPLLRALGRLLLDLLGQRLLEPDQGRTLGPWVSDCRKRRGLGPCRPPEVVDELCVADVLLAARDGCESRGRDI